MRSRCFACASHERRHRWQREVGDQQRDEPADRDRIRRHRAAQRLELVREPFQLDPDRRGVGLHVRHRAGRRRERGGELSRLAGGVGELVRQRLQWLGAENRQVHRRRERVEGGAGIRGQGGRLRNGVFRAHQAVVDRVE
jgi:hypothetical protein